MKWTESEIIKGFQDNNDLAIRYVFEHFGPKVIGYVVNNSGNEEEGHEILQETILKVWNNIRHDRYKDNGTFGSYFYRIAANTWLDRLRKRKKRGTIPLSQREFELKDSSIEDKEVAFVQQEQHQALYRCLLQLGEVCQELIKKFHFEEVPLKELAVEFSMEYSTVRKRIFDCRNRLKKFLQQALKAQLS